MKRLALCAVLATLLSLTAQADEILLKNGNLIRGEIISRDDKQIRINIPYTDQVTGKQGKMEMTFSATQVRSVTDTGTIFSKTKRTRVDAAKTSTSTKAGDKKKTEEVEIDWDYRLDIAPEFVKDFAGDAKQMVVLKKHQEYVEQETDKLIKEKAKLKKSLDKIQGGSFDDDKISDSALLELNLIRYYDEDVWDTEGGKKIRPLARDLEKRKLILFKWSENFNDLAKKAEAAKKKEEPKPEPVKKKDTVSGPQEVPGTTKEGYGKESVDEDGKKTKVWTGE